MVTTHRAPTTSIRPFNESPGCDPGNAVTCRMQRLAPEPRSMRVGAVTPAKFQVSPSPPTGGIRFPALRTTRRPPALPRPRDGQAGRPEPVLSPRTPDRWFLASTLAAVASRASEIGSARRSVSSGDTGRCPRIFFGGVADGRGVRLVAVVQRVVDDRCDERRGKQKTDCDHEHRGGSELRPRETPPSASRRAQRRRSTGLRRIR